MAAPFWIAICLHKPMFTSRIYVSSLQSKTGRTLRYLRPVRPVLSDYIFSKQTASSYAFAHRTLTSAHSCGTAVTGSIIILQAANALVPLRTPYAFRAPANRRQVTWYLLFSRKKSMWSRIMRYQIRSKAGMSWRLSVRNSTALQLMCLLCYSVFTELSQAFMPVL